MLNPWNATVLAEFRRGLKKYFPCLAVKVLIPKIGSCGEHFIIVVKYYEFNFSSTATPYFWGLQLGVTSCRQRLVVPCPQTPHRTLHRVADVSDCTAPFELHC